MVRSELEKEIIRQQDLLLKLASKSQNPMQDAAVYAKSLEIDKLIVSYMIGERKEKREYLASAI